MPKTLSNLELSEGTARWYIQTGLRAEEALAAEWKPAWSLEIYVEQTLWAVRQHSETHMEIG